MKRFENADGFGVQEDAMELLGGHVWCMGHLGLHVVVRGGKRRFKLVPRILRHYYW